MTLNLRQHLLASTLFVGAASFALPAVAQTPPPPIDQSQTTNPAETTDTTGPVEAVNDAAISSDGNQDVETGEEIVVTGSRIPQPNLTSTSPVTVINSAEVRLQGTTRTEDLINSLPQAFAAQGSNVSNGATGTATVNLRGLGSTRTLVLVNGRRLLPGDPGSPVADINLIPAAIIKRVDVLTGGASSVYGADAVSGVVNFIMDTTFEGFQIEGQYSLFDHKNNGRRDVREAIAARNFDLPSGRVADGGTYDLSAVFGAGLNDNRGHVTAYATYRKQDAVLQADRDYSACAISAVNQSTVTRNGRLFNCGGSATSANGTFFTNNPDDVFQVGPNRTFIPGSTTFNFAPFNYYQRPDERYTFGLFGNYEISESVKPYVEAMFMDDQSVAQIAPSGNFGNTLSINCDNPLLSPQQRSLICVPGNFITGPGFDTSGATPQVFTNPNGTTYNQAILQPLRRNVEGGGRQDDLQHTDYRIVVGARGKIARGLSYDAYYQYGKVVFAETYFNDFSVSRLGRALDVVTGANGQPVCRSVADGTDANCVPYDIFALGQVTPGALAYLQTPGFQRGNTQERVANASLTALLGEYGLRSPLATEGIGLNVGAEYRKESSVLNTDTAFSTGDLAGQGGATIGISGQFNVKEVFAELRVPLIEDRPFFHSLSVGAGYRYSRYKNSANSFSTNTYKFEGDWSPIRDIRIRATYNRAIRAPNITELFDAQTVLLDGSFDPCAGPAVNGTVNGFTAAQCALTGVSAAQFGNIVENPAGQYNGLLGGNPNLTPEKATSKTLGVVFQPQFFRGFAATVDYFDIKLKDQIGVIGADTILTQCVNTGDNGFCSLINRDQFGSLFRTNNGFVVDTNLNAGGLSTRGIDVAASYSRSIGGLGSLGLSVVGTWLDQLITDPTGDPKYDCVGYYGAQCGTPNPEFRGKVRLTYTSPIGIGLSGQWRFFDSVLRDTESNDPDLQGGVIPNNGGLRTLPGNRLLPSQSYFDLTLTARIGDRYNFRLGANNILDKDPPLAGQLAAGFGNGNTYPQVYDSLGRYIFAGVTLDF